MPAGPPASRSLRLARSSVHRAAARCAACALPAVRSRLLLQEGRDTDGPFAAWSASANRKGRPRAALKKNRRRPTLPGLKGQVPSALRGLTALFGMGRGVSPSL